VSNDPSSGETFGYYGAIVVSRLTFILSNLPTYRYLSDPRCSRGVPIFEQFPTFNSVFERAYSTTESNTIVGARNCEREMNDEWLLVINKLEQRSKFRASNFSNPNYRRSIPNDKFLLNVLDIVENQAHKHRTSSMNSTNLELISQSFQDRPSANNDLQVVHSAASGKRQDRTLPGLSCERLTP